MVGRRKLIRLWITAFLPFVAACSDPIEKDSISGINDDVAARQLSAADVAWEVLTAPIDDTGPIPEESDFNSFMRQAELANQRFREAGLEFWDRFPSDPRRYSWLTLTVHLPPYYPEDIEAWTAGEAKPKLINTANQRRDAIQAWQTRYPALRAEFFASDQVSQEQKRYLWFGELRAEIYDIHRARAQGNEPDTSYFIENYLAFVTVFAEPLMATDVPGFKRDYGSQMVRLLALMVFDLHQDGFAWTADEALGMLRLLNERAPSSTHARMIETIERTGALPPKTDGVLYKLDDLTTAQKSWRWATPLHIETGTVSDSQEAQIVSAYNNTILAYRNREIGYSLWNRIPNGDELIRWASGQLPPEHPLWHIDDVAADIRLLAEHRGEEIEIDPAKTQRLRAEFSELRNAFWTSPETTKQQRGHWAASEVGAQANRFRVDGPAAFSAEEVMQFQEGVFSIVEQFGANDTIGPILNDMVTYPSRFGFSDDEFSVFISRLTTLEIDDLSGLLSKYQKRQSMKLEPVDFAATLFDEESTLRLADYRGKYVYLDPWATWCASCIDAMPELHDTYLEYKDRGFAFVSMVNDAERNPKGVRRIVQTLELTWPVVIADQLHIERPELNAYILLDPEGKVVSFQDRLHGPSLRELLEARLETE